MLRFKRTDHPPFWTWALYDWANSAFGAVIISFVYAIYFKKVIVADDTTGAMLWGGMLTVSAVLVAISAPFMGAFVDNSARSRQMLMLMTGMTVSLTALLSLGMPGMTDMGIFLILFVIVLAQVFYELGLTLANALLPRMGDSNRWGRQSGFAWGTGYIGGIFCLGICFLLIDKSDPASARVSALVTAIWFLMFAAPLFLLWREKETDRIKSSLPSWRQVYKSVFQSFRDVSQSRQMLLFLGGSALIRDGLATLFGVGAVYASAVIGLDAGQIIIFGVGMNVAAGIGAFMFAGFEDRIGSRATVVISTLGLIITAGFLLTLKDPMVFLGVALLLGLFVGPAQASCRTILARLSPSDKINSNYGLYSLSGRAVALLGPLLYTVLLALTDSQQIALSSTLMLWAGGLILITMMRPVPEETR